MGQALIFTKGLRRSLSDASEGPLFSREHVLQPHSSRSPEISLLIRHTLSLAELHPTIPSAMPLGCPKPQAGERGGEEERKGRRDVPAWRGITRVCPGRRPTSECFSLGLLCVDADLLTTGSGDLRKAFNSQPASTSTSLSLFGE